MEMEKQRWTRMRMEDVVRSVSTAMLVLTACLVALDTQTKIIILTFAKKATFTDLNALYVLVWIDAAAASYNLIQLLRSYMMPRFRQQQQQHQLVSCNYLAWAWATYLSDQATVYVVFAANTAATQASILAITGEKSFGWMKLCNRYTRFCMQIGGALFCGYVAVILMAITSSISGYALFRHYSPKHFLILKKQ
ncbi:CASP-like protein 2C1 [Andrographis paniculata]|uniref:CASP-like protein 2C1 n=1 Tax=Andrographis paniculata TaxID=175694 RepID=UPI0021E83A91|nr:CASP-like protein 2C1 [Andrographis paniculata]